MRSGFIAILGLAAVFIAAASGIAQQSREMRGNGMMGSGMMNGGMMGGGMMGGRTQGGHMTTQSAAQEGGDVAATYSNLCASCHGANGHGDGPAAMALSPKPRDFADCTVMATDSDDILFKAIKDGGQGIGRSPMMPPWGGSLSDEQIHELVRYIRSFCKNG